MGKTTLLLRLSYEIENDDDLREWLIPVVLKEEAYYGIRHLYRLWETIAQELEGKNKAFSGLVKKMSDAYEQAGRLRSQGDVPQTSSFATKQQAGRLRSQEDVPQTSSFATKEQAGRLRSQEENYERICFEILLHALKGEQDEHASEEEREQNASDSMSRAE